VARSGELSFAYSQQGRHGSAVIARSFSIFLAWAIRLLMLLDEPLVFRDPSFGFCLGIEFAEVARRGVLIALL
jgi:hypothetical protein